MRFTKMHGLGNDYVFVDCFLERILQPEKIARMVSDRHFGIGSDGLILIKPSVKADFEMAMYNADGSKGEMCGNGIRCVAKYVYEKGLTDKTCITIDTLAGLRHISMEVKNGEVLKVGVDMGAPVWEPVIRENLVYKGRAENVTCLSMGNPHCVIFTKESVDDLVIEELGRALQHHPWFPEGVNVEFVNILSEDCLKMRVWERGSGETLACGTGACAAVAAANEKGYVKERVQVQLTGGSLEVFWNKQENRIYMTGTAVKVYEGDYVLPEGLK